MDDLGHQLFKSVTVTFGGDDREYWHCIKCGHNKGLENPNGQVCGNPQRVFSYDSFRDEYFDDTGETLTDAEIDDMDIHWFAHYRDLYDPYITENCQCTEYEYKQYAGVDIDKHDSEWLDLWERISAKPNPEPYSGLQGL